MADSADVTLTSGHFDDQYLQSPSGSQTLRYVDTPRPGPSRRRSPSPRRVQEYRSPSRSPSPISPGEPEDRWTDDRFAGLQRFYEELRHSNNIDELRAFVDENFWNLNRYQFVCEKLQQIVWNYGTSPAHRRAAGARQPHPDELLRIIADLLEDCRLNREEVEMQLQEKYEDLSFKLEKQWKNQILRDRGERRREEEERIALERQHVLEVTQQVPMELLQGLRDHVVPVIQSLTPNADEVQGAVDAWIRATQQAFETRKVEVDNMIQQIEFLELRKRRQWDNIRNLQNEVAELKRRETGAKREVHSLTQRLEELQNTLEATQEVYHQRQYGRGLQPLLEETPPIGSAPVYQSTPIIQEKKKGFIGKIGKKVGKAKERMSRILFTQTPSPDTPGIRRIGTPSPDYPEQQFGEVFESFGIDETPRRASPVPRPPTSFSRTVVLTSPRREEPLLVNINVDPKPLVDTGTGENFVCDISLDVQPGGHGTLPQLPEESGVLSPYLQPLEMSESPVIKGRRLGRRNIPPSITPTSTRRGTGLFTPQGIFKKGQVNIRRIEYPISELPWSPTYLPGDARSPVTSLLSSPPRWSDRSVSWEKQYGSDYASSPSSSPVIKGPTYGHRSPDYSPSSLYLLAFPSPVIAGPSYGYQSPTSDDLTYSSPIIEGSGSRYRSSISDDLTYSSPGIRTPGSRYQSSGSDDLTYSSPVIRRPGSRYRSSGSDDLTYSSPVIRRPGSRYRSSGSDDLTYSSPIIRRPGSRYRSRSDDLTYSSPGIRTPVSRYRRSGSDDLTYASPVIRRPGSRYRSSGSDDLTYTSPVIRRPRSRYRPRSDDLTYSSPGIRTPVSRYRTSGSDDLTYSSPVIRRPGSRYRSSGSDDLTYSSPVIRRPGSTYRSSGSDDLTYSSPRIRRPGSRYRSSGSDDLTYASPGLRGSDDLTYNSPGIRGSDDLTYNSPGMRVSDDISYNLPGMRVSDDLTYNSPGMRVSDDLTYNSPGMRVSDDLTYNSPGMRVSDDLTYNSPGMRVSDDISYNLPGMRVSDDLTYNSPGMRVSDDLTYNSPGMRVSDDLTYNSPGMRGHSR